MFFDPFHENFILTVRNYMLVNELTIFAFSKQCGVSQPTIKRVLDGGNTALGTMARIAEGMGMELIEIPKSTETVMDFMEAVAQWMESPGFRPELATPQIQRFLNEQPEIVSSYIPILTDMLRSGKTTDDPGHSAAEPRV